MKKTMTALLICGTALFLAACAGASGGKADSNIPEFVLTYAENQAEDYPTTQGAYKFAELVKETEELRKTMDEILSEIIKEWDGYEQVFQNG